MRTVLSWMEHAADRFNPILVKETRQALKSRQFTGTFMLLLVASLLVSFGGVAMVGPNIDYQSTGAAFFVAYFAVLAFAIFVVVPFGAYRSLAAEQEERTYELLSITTLRPGQIVTGKLLTSMIQMFIYASAIAPFMAFTYLLKGIDIPSILFILSLAVLGSIGFSMVGLFMATFATRRGWQVLLSVVMILGLALATIGSVVLAVEIVDIVGGAFRDPEFWIAMGCVLTAYVTSVALMYQLSISQLTFESDNRSSRVRVVLLLQFLAGVAWVGWAWIMELQGERVFLEVMAGIGCFYWGVMGSFLIAERDGVSRRVQRQIPRSGLWRMFTAVFFPGSGTGLAFVLIHLAIIAVLIPLAELTEAWAVLNYRPRGTRGEATALAIVMISYSLFYLGLGALVVRLIRRFRPVPPIGGAAITAILAAAGVLIPNFFVMTLRTAHYQVYEFWQVSDPIATTDQVARLGLHASAELVLPVIMAGTILLLNVPAMARAFAALVGFATEPARSRVPVAGPLPAGIAIRPLAAASEPVH